MNLPEAGQSLLNELVRFLEWMQGVGAGGALSKRAMKCVFSQVNAPSPVLFDVGAHRGAFIKAALAQKQSAGFHLHAFEPGKAAYRQLSSWASALPNVVLNQAALSSSAGSGILFYDTPASERSSLTPRVTVPLAQSEAVKLDTLDNYCRERGIDTIHLLKLTVEGHELEVLRGGEELFRRSAIHAVLFEFGGAHVDARVFFLDLYNFFTGFDMKINRLTPSGYLHRIESYSEGLERFRTTRYLAIY